MHRIQALCAVLGFVMISIALLPLIVFDFNAPVENFPTVTVVYGDSVAHYQTAAQTVGELLRDLDKILAEHDRIDYPSGFPIYDGMVLHIIREVAFYVVVDSGAPVRLVVPGGTTVFEIIPALEEVHGVVLLSVHNTDRPIEPMDVLYFLSWRSRYFTALEEIPFDVIENHTGEVRYGRTYLSQTGAPGEREYTTTVFYLGGEERSRVISNEIIHVEPLATVYDVGIAPLGALADTSAPEFRYVRRIRMQATAYCACVRCTGREPDDRRFGITASGRQVEHGIVAVDRTVIPLGTHLYVSNYGFSIAADVGGAIRGYRIDLYMECHEEARRFGRRYVYVYVLE
jgi:3D (Asp-Asp-Asp) domain-containing protein